jgi:uncharacterized YigZ family protein
MNEIRTIPAGFAREELQVSNSRFIASAGPAFTVEEARKFIQKVRSEFPDATHNVPAFLVGHGASVITHCSDDGEPTGTAGRPALAVLQGSGLGDTVVVITRYYGGTKLGTGGLVKAYTEAVQKVLKTVPLAQKRATHTALLSVSYPYYERVRILVRECMGEVMDEEFGADGTLTLRFPIEDFERFQTRLLELSRGAVQAVVIETEENTIFPIK